MLTLFAKRKKYNYFYVETISTEWDLCPFEDFKRPVTKQAAHFCIETRKKQLSPRLIRRTLLDMEDEFNFDFRTHRKDLHVELDTENFRCRQLLARPNNGMLIVHI